MWCIRWVQSALLTTEDNPRINGHVFANIGRLKSWVGFVRIPESRLRIVCMGNWPRISHNSKADYPLLEKKYCESILDFFQGALSQCRQMAWTWLNIKTHQLSQRSALDPELSSKKRNRPLRFFYGKGAFMRRNPCFFSMKCDSEAPLHWDQLFEWGKETSASRNILSENLEFEFEY